eukprot:TRINITY_DN34314_c0_g1_i3.p3 TRINITY_DN34314_c0_g1~~TRINITY_DN34314_c0_g1_i3.p3  ORF type:complete len:105 (-),score=20.58 TRINITY_DN34314_c0_g1_i3:53-367(-)
MTLRQRRGGSGVVASCPAARSGGAARREGGEEARLWSTLCFGVVRLGEGGLPPLASGIASHAGPHALARLASVGRDWRLVTPQSLPAKLSAADAFALLLWRCHA